jgi:ABC-type Na+ efflux pump permease subunit
MSAILKQRAAAGVTVLFSSHQLDIVEDIILVWVLISVYGSQIALGIGEEKASRVIEVLLSSVRPMQLLIGKVFGIGLLLPARRSP